ncbi:hypothetical protein SARC_12153 [Sphaeroforma arctica JP610]|uniref:Glutaredoxin-like protein n=1 Tax=Sphaeroforma arctica JP610 TaxID=667725 RepID=A0A0L0FEZ3_9EUKA|nr:hypothetical protein SARC_12153 [Sphaeroforma arctica JP610]KNC75320.1 hypothetical protein SARC_12153 [Sphaeroforma arctica JP610]|eukprot:XP_014149222.1 hypothetical protein SARC_12153 [Sphaeroforma arctica JP610]
MRAALRLYQAQKVLLPRLSFYGKSGECMLCDQAKQVLLEVEDEAPHSVEWIDITDPREKEAFDEYKWDIPVLHLNGKEIMRHRFDAKKLVKLLHESQTTVGKG